MNYIAAEPMRPKLQESYKVYALLDERGCILSVNCADWMQDTAGWTLIDEGSGDKYHHALGNYLPGPISGIDGIPRYRWDGSQVVERTEEEIEADRTPIIAAETRAKRDELLKDTDKYAVLDAPISAETRTAMYAYRQALRDVPEQAGFPGAVVWPELPAIVKAAPDPVDEAFDTLTGGGRNA